jgi:putative SOS response-associated peptidase YedK
MCNLYNMTSSVEAIRAFVKVFEVDERRKTNWPPLPEIFPDYEAPIIRNTPAGRQLTTARWGMPTPRSVLDKGAMLKAAKLEAKGKPYDLAELKRMEKDFGVTNIRNTASPHWRRWLEVDHRCVVPMTRFSENAALPDGSHPPVWFALKQPLAFFAGIYVSNWESVRKVRDGLVTADLYAFLTTEPNAEVAPIHAKAMPVILRTAEEVETWLTAPREIALHLQRPLPDGSLRIVEDERATPLL